MIKVKIVLDEEKIIRERKYSLQKMWTAIDKIFVSKNFKVEEKGLYAGTNHPHDFANVWVVNSALGREDWFLDNIKEWKYLNNDMFDDVDTYNVEDLLKDSKYYKVGFR